MAHSYSPAYYSSFQHSIASLCKSLLPFRGRSLLADSGEARRHADALKWQQESFHRILHLTALKREGIVQESEVRDYRRKMLAELVSAAAAPAHPPSAGILRDKLLFLQELLYAKCISAEEFDSAKLALMRQLTSLGVEVDLRRLDVGKATAASNGDDEWSAIDLHDSPLSHQAAGKPKKDGPSFKAIMSKKWKNKGKKEVSMNPEKALLADENAPCPSPVTVAAESLRPFAAERQAKAKRKPFASLFYKEEKDNENELKKGSSWGFDGLEKWKKSSGNGECSLEFPEPKQFKNEPQSLHSSKEEEVLAEKTKKELSRIKSELQSSPHQNLSFSNEQIRAISTKLPMNKSDLNNFFPKAWCDQHGDVVLSAMKAEFSEHIGEMEKKGEEAEKEISATEDSWAGMNDSRPNFYPHLFHQKQQQPLLKKNNPFI